MNTKNCSKYILLLEKLGSEVVNDIYLIFKFFFIAQIETEATKTLNWKITILI